MGPVSAEVVIATFYNFNPSIVRAAIPAVWRIAAPDKIVPARIDAVDATLRRILRPALGSPALRRAATLAKRAAESIGDHVQGRPLYAAHAAQPWPDEPHLALWHAQTLLREYRGDGHVAALLTAGLSGIEALVTHAAAGPVSGDALRTTRGWSVADWTEAIDGLRHRGWLTSDVEPTFTPIGRLARQQIEETTDMLADGPYAELGTNACDELEDLGKQLTAPIVAELMPWARPQQEQTG
jgi:hypothetical protein